MDLCCLLCCKPSLEFEDYAFLLAGAAFVCILGSEALIFIKGIFFLFEPHRRLLRIGSKHHYGPLWMPVPLVAFTGELHGGDNGVSQLARGFI
jgi:hypothetical protein